MAAVRTRPYRRILTSALHRRFVHASALSLLVCYLVAILIGNKSSCKYFPILWSRASTLGSLPRERTLLTILTETGLWLWFPIGTCGIRTAMLFLSCLTVFVLRVSQMHIGSRTSASSFGIFKQFTFFQIAQTFGWYIFSAWWFTQIYIWSSSADNDLQLVKRGRYVKRLRNIQTLD
jgi:nucleoporin NDC1